jgi:flagellar basal body rod protein FlgC
MISALSFAASALSDATVRLDVAANNLANVNTRGFQPAQVDSVEQTGGGVTPVVTPSGPTPAVDVSAQSGTDVAREMASLVITLLALASNARVARAAAHAEGKVLDILA